MWAEHVSNLELYQNYSHQLSLYTPQPLYNTIVGVHSIIRVS